MNRRVFLKQIIGGGLLLLGLGSGSYHYARNIEPKSLHIQEETILLQKKFLLNFITLKSSSFLTHISVFIIQPNNLVI